MSKARLHALGEGRFSVSGVLDAATVTDVLKDSEQRFPSAPRLEIDLGGVVESDSAGLALLIEWLRGARERGQAVHFANLPAQINALARISEVEDLIATNGTAAAGAATA